MNACYGPRMAVMRGVARFVSWLGFDGVRRLGTALGELMWLCLAWRRDLATKNIQRHLGMDEAEAQATARQSFRHTARAFMEIGLTDDFGLDKEGGVLLPLPQLWHDLCACKRPVVAVSAHMGAWELLAAMLGDMYEAPRPRMVVVRRYDDPVVQDFITARRESHGATMVGHRAVAASVLKALRHKGLVAFLVDHHALRTEALRLPFLGEDAAVNMGPALLALRAEALIWPIFLIRKTGPDGRTAYEVKMRKPLDTTLLTGSREEKVREAAQFYTGAVEDMVRECPEQWFWMHNRWKP